VSPAGLVADPFVPIPGDLPIDWIVVLEQEERTGQCQPSAGSLHERRCPNETEHMFVE
jgi:hypothetical protein